METFRDSTFGQLVRLVSRNEHFQYPEERSEFKLSPSYNPPVKEAERDDLNSSGPVTGETSSRQSSSNDIGEDENGYGGISGVATHALDLERAITQSTTHHVPSRTLSRQIVPSHTKDGVTLVDWYTTGVNERELLSL